MGDDQDRRLLVEGDAAQQVHDNPGPFGIERRRRLVGEDDLRPVGQRSGDRDALRLPAGQLGRHCIPPASDLQVVEEFDGPRPGSSRAQARQLHDLHNVLGRVEERQEIVGLEDEPDLFKPQPPQIAAQPALIVDGFAVEAHPAAARLGDAADDVEQGRLARAAGADEADDLPRKYRGRDVRERIDAPLALAKMLRDGAQLDQGIGVALAHLLTPERSRRIDLDRRAYAERGPKETDDHHDREQSRQSPGCISTRRGK
jgi:hypothetical protein